MFNKCGRNCSCSHIYHLINFYISEPPPSIIPPQNVSALPGEDAIMSCFVFSTVDHNISWYKVGRNLQLKSNRKFHVLNNGSIIIRYRNSRDFFFQFCNFKNYANSFKNIFFLKDSNILCCQTSK